MTVARHLHQLHRAFAAFIFHSDLSSLQNVKTREDTDDVNMDVDSSKVKIDDAIRATIEGSLSHRCSWLMTSSRRDFPLCFRYFKELLCLSRENSDQSLQLARDVICDCATNNSRFSLFIIELFMVSDVTHTHARALQRYFVGWAIRISITRYLQYPPITIWSFMSWWCSSNREIEEYVREHREQFIDGFRERSL